MPLQNTAVTLTRLNYMLCVCLRHLSLSPVLPQKALCIDPKSSTSILHEELHQGTSVMDGWKRQDLDLIWTLEGWVGSVHKKVVNRID